MRVLYHWPLDPQSRQCRIALAETKLKFKLVQVNPWAPDDAFLKLAPESALPTLVDTVTSGKVAIHGARAVCEYAHDSSARSLLLSQDPIERAEARRLCSWFDGRFQDEVNAYVLHERVEKGLAGGGAPHPPTLRTGREHLAFHMNYIEWLLESRPWLACSHFTLADSAAGANLSCLDFLGEISWKKYPLSRSWYQKLKSRPSFQPLLTDRIPGITPPAYYADLDF